MKQILQSLSSGEIAVENIPVPKAKTGELLIETSRTLISAGTERMLMDFGKAGLIGKVKQQPDKVKQVLEKMKTDGVLTTIDAVRSKLDQPIPLGYCNVGRVLDTGNIAGFSEGDRVLSNGNHAEVVRVPKNLCVKVPESVSDEEATFTVLGAIGLQGIRLLQPTLGEFVVVQGLGLIGLVAVQLLVAHGCRVLGADFDKEKLALAKQFGAEVVDLGAGEDLIAKAEQFSRGRGVDAVLITASAKTDDIVHQAATVCRKRGRIVLVGVIGLNLRRDDFYEKELSFQVSCSYGPGRYDDTYEQQGQDYPIGFVRWTEQRNFEAVLDMMASGKLDVKPLISKRFAIDDAKAAYEALDDKRNLGILLEYASGKNLERVVNLSPSPQLSPDSPNCAEASMGRQLTTPIIGFVGAGNYASRMLMPAFKSTGAKLKAVITNQGVSGVIHGKKYGFAQAGTDFDTVLQDDAINTVVIATRHGLHAKQTLAALQAGKHVFVEKPLCLTLDELADIQEFYNSPSPQPSLVKREGGTPHNSPNCAEASMGRQLATHQPLLMLGFNRRFSPHIQKIKSLISPLSAPKNFVMTVNAGFIPKDHWTQDSKIGGGRLIGEGCHFIDLLRFLAGSPIAKADIANLTHLSEGAPLDENITVTLQFEDGSMGTVHYFANGHKAVAKERLEVFVAGKVLQLDNFRKLRAYGFGSCKKMNLWQQDKGQKACAKAFVGAVSQGKSSPIPLDEVIEVSRICIELSKRVQND